MTITASWVTSLARMEKLAEDLVGWNLHPHDIVTHRFSLEEIDVAYKAAAAGETGKVCIVNGGD
jgi:threonine dehydrogenase-like Zn-dependent dehydrogenase